MRVMKSIGAYLFFAPLLLLDAAGPGAVGQLSLLAVNRLVAAIIVNAVLALGAYFGKAVSKSGAVGGFVVGALIYYFTDWRGYLVLITFFILGTLVTKVRYEEKAQKGIAQEDKGRRGAKHAVANCAAGLILGVLYWLSIGEQGAVKGMAMIYLVGFTGSFATALSDTASSEIGQAFGKTTVLLTGFRRVPPGTEGAVSVEGTVAGIIASILLALVAARTGLISFYGWGLEAVVIAAFIGNTLESLIGSTLERIPFITNEVTNFINTVIGALAAMALYWLFNMGA